MDKTKMLDTEKTSPRLVSKRHEGCACRLVLCSCCALLGAISFGYAIGYSSPAIPELEQLEILQKSQSGWFGSLMAVGALLGGPAGGWLIEKFGRKTAMKITTFPFLFGWMCISCAGGAWLLFLGRFLCGIGSGLITVCVPVYIAEIATKNLRGTLGAGVQLAITIGIFAAYVAGTFMSYWTMSVIGIALAVFTFMLLFCVPETPRWLLMQGKKNEAVLSLQSLRHVHADCEDECRDIEEGLNIKETFAWSEFKKPELLRPLLISVFIMIFQQLSGINAVMFYSESIFKKAGIQKVGIATCSIGLVQMIVTVIPVLVMDRLGRRRLLIIAGSIMSLSCCMFAWHFNKPAADSETDSGFTAISSLVIYITGFSLGWGPVPMLIMSEIFPLHVRGAASGITSFVNWTCAFIVTKEFFFIQDTFGISVTFLTFAVICMGGVVFVWRKVPETKGKSLEEIERFFLGKSIM